MEIASHGPCPGRPVNKERLATLPRGCGKRPPTETASIHKSQRYLVLSDICYQVAGAGQRLLGGSLSPWRGQQNRSRRSKTVVYASGWNEPQSCEISGMTGGLTWSLAASECVRHRRASEQFSASLDDSSDMLNLQHIQNPIRAIRAKPKHDCAPGYAGGSTIGLSATEQMPTDSPVMGVY